MKVFLSLVGTLCLLYGAYVVNDQFLSAPKKEAKVEEAPVPVEQMTAQKLVNDIPAYDPADPSTQIGTFLKGTDVRTAPSTAVPAMKQVVFTTPQGKMIQALCKEEDLAKPAPPEPNRPLETVQAMKASDEKNALAKSTGKSTLGSGATTICEGCPAKRSEVVKMGQSSANVKSSLGGSSMKPLPQPAAPTTPQTPAQNIKQKAKDLQQMQADQPAP
jgi:hypothetical protein